MIHRAMVNINDRLSICAKTLCGREYEMYVEPNPKVEDEDCVVCKSLADETRPQMYRSVVGLELSDYPPFGGSFLWDG